MVINCNNKRYALGVDFDHASGRRDEIMATTRDRLREAAAGLFSERGFDAATIGDIEARAGLAPRAGSFYRHYKSKQEIFDDCVAALSADIAAEFDFSHIFPLRDLRAELLALGRTIMGFAEKRRTLRMFMRRAAQHDARRLDALQAVNRRFYDDTLISWLERTLKENGRENMPARETAALIFGPILYHMLQRDIGSAPFDLSDDALIESWADFWAQILTAKGAVSLPPK